MTDPSQTQAAAPEPIALLQIGDATIALPSAIVREVVRWPERMTPTSDRDDALLGYFPLRDDALPLYDLPRVLNLSDKPGGAMVAIVDLGAGRVGLAIDAAKGFSTLPADRLSALARKDVAAGPPLYKLFNDPETGRITLYLDQALLMALPGMMVVADAPRAAGGARATRTLAAARSGACELLCFEWRDLSFVIDVRYVREIVTAPPFEKLRLMSDIFLGQARIRDEDVAIVDLDAALRRPKGAESQPPIVLLLDIDGRRFGVPATRVVELLERAGVERAAFPQDRARGDVISASAGLSGGRRALEIDAPALSAMKPVRELAEKLNRIAKRPSPTRPPRAETQAEADVEAKAGPVAAAETCGDPKRKAAERLSGYIRMSAGGPVYADLRNLLQLLELDVSDLFLSEARPELAGYLTHRGEVAPVLDLALHLGADPAFSKSDLNAPVRVALAKCRSGMVGLIVDGFDSIEHLSIDRDKRHLRHQADLEDVSTICRPAISYLTAQDRSGSKTIKFLDLDHLAGDFHPEAAPPEAREAAAAAPN